MIKKALLIDDDEIYRAHLSDALTRRLTDCVIVTAGNGLEAEKIMGLARMDFVITDLLMPEMDGFEFVSRARTRHPDVPILVITGMRTPEVEERLHALGISRCLEKPFDARRLVPRILGELGGVLSGGGQKKQFK